MSRTPTAKKKLGSIRAGDSFPHIREIYTLKPSHVYLTVLVLPLAYRRDRWTDFDAQYVMQRGSAQGSAFWGLENLNLISNLFFFEKMANMEKVEKFFKLSYDSLGCI